MFENVDELIDVNLKLLYQSKSQFMMRINFKDECGFNLKNTKIFAEILDHRGLVIIEKEQGFRCDISDFGKKIYETGGWTKHLETSEALTKFKNIAQIDSEVKEIQKSFQKKIMIAGIIVLVLSFFITLIAADFIKIS